MKKAQTTKFADDKMLKMPIIYNFSIYWFEECKNEHLNLKA